MVNGCAIASTASPKAVSATASLIRLSPSRMVTTRCGAPSRVSTDVAATASVGATAAANASAGAQLRPGRTSRVTHPTLMIVAAVAPKASPVIGMAFSRLSPGGRQERGVIDERRQEQQQHDVRRQFHLRHVRNQADQDAEHDQYDRVRYFEPA